MSPRPGRGEMWTCGICGSQNEPFRTTCINTSRHPAPTPPESD